MGTLPGAPLWVLSPWKSSLHQAEITSVARTGPFFTSTKLISRTSGNSCIYLCSLSINPIEKKLTRVFSRTHKWCKSHIPESDSKRNCQTTARNGHAKPKSLQTEATALCKQHRCSDVLSASQASLAGETSPVVSLLEIS